MTVPQNIVSLIAQPDAVYIDYPSDTIHLSGSMNDVIYCCNNVLQRTS